LKLSSASRRKTIVLGLLFLFAANLWVYLNYTARKEKAIALRGLPLAEPLGDLYPRWRGTQELIDHHLSPYGPEVSGKIQMAYYHRLLGAPDDPKDQQRFAYPVYVALLLAPFVHLPFETVRVIFSWLLLAITVASLHFWLRMLHVSIDVPTFIVIALMTGCSVPAQQGLNLQQLGLLVAGSLAAAAALVVNGRLFLAGAALSIASIKPQMCVLVFVWLLFWVVADWAKRKPLLWGLISAMAVLILAGEALSPGWLKEFLGGLIAYDQYTGGAAMMTTLVPKPVAFLFSSLAILGVATVCWRLRGESPGTPGFSLTFCLVLSLTTLVVPTVTAVFNQLLLLPAFILSFTRWRSLLKRSSLPRTACLALAGVAVSPWPLAAFANLVWLISPERGFRHIWAVPVYANALVPFTIFALLVFLAKGVLHESTSTRKDLINQGV
jgi:hypothetical protein